MQFNDVVTFTLGRRQTDESGFVRTPAVITKVGVQQYTKDQLGIPGVSGRELVNVFRPPETVFHADTIASFGHKPVTDGHPPRGVTIRNSRQVVGGHIGEDVQKIDDLTLGSTIHLTDEGFITKSKGSQTSAGYDAEIIADSGEWEGQKYDYRFDGAMIGNHLALVPNARCGKGCAVLDEENNKGKKMDAEDKKEVAGMIDAKFDELKKGQISKEDVASTVAESLKNHTDEQARKAKEDADKKKADEDAKKADEDKEKEIEQRVQRKADVLAKVKPLMKDEDYNGVKDKETKEILVACMKDSIDKADEKSEDYLEAMLDTEIAKRKDSRKGVHDATQSTGGIKIPKIGQRRR